MSDKEVTLAQLKKAFADGYDAFYICDEIRKMPTVNPYPIKSILGKEWQRGYDRNFVENKKRVDSGVVSDNPVRT